MLIRIQNVSLSLLFYQYLRRVSLAFIIKYGVLIVFDCTDNNLLQLKLSVIFSALNIMNNVT